MEPKETENLGENVNIKQVRPTFCRFFKKILKNVERKMLVSDAGHCCVGVVVTRVNWPHITSMFFLSVSVNWCQLIC